MKNTLFFLAQLFQGDSWVCMGRGIKQHDCRRLRDWADDIETRITEEDTPIMKDPWELIVPTSQLARTGLTSDGYPSTHALTNCDGRKYLVAEFDIKPYARDGVTPTFWLPVIERWEQMGVNTQNAQVALIHYVSKNAKPVMIIQPEILRSEPQE
jgi:hypothetical protein